MTPPSAEHRPRVLVLSDLFPTPLKPAYGIFVERQTSHVQAYCDNVVISPTRVFPHMRVWKGCLQSRRLIHQWQEWQHEISQVPSYSEQFGYPVYYPRYTSPPHQITHALWGFCAYPALRSLLQRLHARHSFELIHAHYGTPGGVIALLARRWMRVPVIISVHGLDVTYTAKQNAFGHAITRWALRNADQVIANSTWTARRIEYYSGMSRSQILYYGSELSNITAPVRATKADEVVTLLSVGYVETRKGQGFVLQALRRLIDEGHQLRYVIVGDGSGLPQAHEITRALGLEPYVSFEGYKPHTEVGPYFAGCDIFVLPSWEEAFGLVYVEALGQGKPVIGCAGEGGPEDLRRFGDCIELVRPRDVDSLTDALRRLIKDPLRRRQMGESGRAIVAEHFSWANNARQTVALYQRVLGKYTHEATSISSL